MLVGLNLEDFAWQALPVFGDSTHYHLNLHREKHQILFGFIYWHNQGLAYPTGGFRV